MALMYAWQRYFDASCTVMILATIFNSSIADRHRLQDSDSNRTCIPAEAEPILNSSSCYPLVNFTRPFCENHGIILPKYVYRTPDYQINKNEEMNRAEERAKRLGESKIRSWFNINISKMQECFRILSISLCHFIYPICDQTQSVYQEQKICRETYFNMKRICYDIVELFIKYDINRNPEKKKLARGELQPYRNAGDSPECWYEDFENLTDTSPEVGSAAILDCLYLNGSSYHGNISVTATGISCQSWTEQCPHRHTMNTTYPELNNAKNYCRNPKNSGKRPWCFTTDRSKRWEYCDIPKCSPVHGNYGNWSLKEECNVSCGEGFETWLRDCKNPEPKFGGRNCSKIGEPVEYRPCRAKPCPVNSGYGNWSVIIPCNVSCGEGVEIWQRNCDNQEPNYSGSNCSGQGNSIELRKCKRKTCHIAGSYGNWTKASPCSVTCGQGVEIWMRLCNIPPGADFSENCSKLGAAYRFQVCEMKHCSDLSKTRTISIIIATVVSVFLVVVFVLIVRKQKPKEDSSHSATPENRPREYGNLTPDGNPIPHYSRGVVLWRRDYVNTRCSQSSWYDRLQLFPPLAVDWLRNAWGNVDESGNHVYDVLGRHVRNVFVPYDDLCFKTNTVQEGNGTELYDTPERSSAVILPTEIANYPTTQIA